MIKKAIIIVLLFSPAIRSMDEEEICEDNVVNISPPDPFTWGTENFYFDVITRNTKKDCLDKKTKRELEIVANKIECNMEATYLGGGNIRLRIVIPMLATEAAMMSLQNDLRTYFDGVKPNYTYNGGSPW